MTFYQMDHDFNRIRYTIAIYASAEAWSRRFGKSMYPYTMGLRYYYRSNLRIDTSLTQVVLI